MTDNATVADPRAAAREDVSPTRPTTIGWVIIATVCVVAAFCVASLALAPAGQIQFNYQSERGSVTFLSCFMLFAAGCLAVRNLVSMLRDTVRARLLWAALSLVMFYFSVDEVYGFHERGGLFLDEHVPRGPFRTWNDLIVIAYGVLLLPVAAFLWREVLRYPRLMTMLIVTGVLYVGTSSVDTLVENATPLSIIVEEGIKVYCSTFFALSMLTGSMAIRWLRRTGQAH